MKNNEFENLAIKAVEQYMMDKFDIPYQFGDYEVYVVWMCKTLQNNKALLSTDLSDGMYYEVTYNGDKKEIYLDAYKKFENKCIKLGEDK